MARRNKNINNTCTDIRTILVSCPPVQRPPLELIRYKCLSSSVSSLREREGLDLRRNLIPYLVHELRVLTLTGPEWLSARQRDSSARHIEEVTLVAEGNCQWPTCTQTISQPIEGP